MKNQKFQQITRTFAVTLISIGLMSYPVLGTAQSSNSNSYNSLLILSSAKPTAKILTKLSARRLTREQLLQHDRRQS